MARLTAVPVYRTYKTTITVNLNQNVTGETLTCEGRASRPDDSTLLVTFDVTVDDETSGALTLVSLPADITEDAASEPGGWLNVKRLSSGVPIPGTPAIKFLFEELPTS